MEHDHDISGPCVYVPWHEYDWHHPLQCNSNHNGIKLHWNPAVFCILAAIHGISIYITLDLMWRTLIVFKRWRTLYFWSLQSVCLGQALAVLVVDLGIFVLPPNSRVLLALNLCSIILLPAGFSLVLYSRLYLVMPPEHQRLQRILLVCIVALDIGLLTPQVVAAIFISNDYTRETLRLQKLILYIAVVFVCKHVGLISLYIYYFRRNWMDGLSSTSAKIRHLLVITYYQLIVFCVILVLCKAILLYLLVKDLMLLRSTVMSIVYSVMLIFELYILDRILEISKLRMSYLREGNLSIDVRSECVDCMIDAQEKRSHTLSDIMLVVHERAISDCSDAPMETSNHKPQKLRMSGTSQSSFCCPSCGGEETRQTPEH